MTMTGPVDWTIASLAEEYSRKNLSPVEVTRAYLDRIDSHNESLGAFITVTADQALAAAREAEKEIREGRTKSPLHGVPMAIKDQFWTEAVRTTGGSRLLSDFIPNQNSTLVNKLNTAGVVSLGKLNMAEFALGGTRHYPYGQPRNPWDLDRNPGMSSAGSGIAVSASLATATIGEDTGGSVRLPAAMSGVAGLRPTYGRVSRYGMLAGSWSLDIAGPLTRTVEDCALVMNAIAGYDTLDPTSANVPVPDFTGSLGKGVHGLKVGYIQEMMDPAVNDPEVQGAIEAALAVFAELGARVQRISIPLAPLAAPIAIAILDTDAAAVQREDLRSKPDLYDAATRMRLQAGALIPAHWQLTAQKARGRLREQMMNAMKSVDVLVSPVSGPAPEIVADNRPFSSTEDVVARQFGARSYTTIHALAALPAISIPCGFTQGKLPLGIQIGGRPFDEVTVLRAAAAYESATDWHLQRPSL